MSGNHPGRLSDGATDFIDDTILIRLLDQPAPDDAELTALLDKSLSKTPLNVAETARLLRVERPDHVERLFEAARRLKRDVYGNRIVLFAPLYIGNHCVNDCAYCAFRRSNTESIRQTLNEEELRAQIAALENVGHKRLILVFGEHPHYGPDFIAQCVRQAYSVREGRGEIRRVNINAAPMDLEGYKVVKEAGIGTYQIFQETYHHETYRKVHPARTLKADYLWRLDGLSRAMEAGCDDVGIGALFGLADWRFDVLGLVSHALFLQTRYGVGPHTISFPRLRPAHGTTLTAPSPVSDEAFKRLVAILRLAVPYTGMILTAREPAAVRRELMRFGVSQIDAGSRIELGGYGAGLTEQQPEREQFELGDLRSLDEVTRDLLENGDLPSWCTSCYRLGRTGEHFMEFAIPGFIQRHCTPNALTTLTEYLMDYAGEETRAAGFAAINLELSRMPDGPRKDALLDHLRRIREEGLRDVCY